MVDFLGIGAQKAGTTWLFRQLSRHPQISFPAGKELHFWDRADPEPAAGWLRALEPPARLCPAGRPVRSGEITPAYAILPQDTIAAIRRACPEARLFISLRNPMERAWSAAVMDLRRCRRSEEDTPDDWFLEHFHSVASRARGDYADCLERWWSAFPREQLLVMMHDDIRRRPADVLTRLARHLAVDPTDFARIHPAELAEVVVPGLGPDLSVNDRPTGAIRESLEPFLRELYAPAIHRLSAVLECDLGAWLDPSPRCEGAGHVRRVVDLSESGATHVRGPTAGGAAPAG